MECGVHQLAQARDFKPRQKVGGRLFIALGFAGIQHAALQGRRHTYHHIQLVCFTQLPPGFARMDFVLGRGDKAIAHLGAVVEEKNAINTVARIQCRSGKAQRGFGGGCVEIGEPSISRQNCIGFSPAEKTKAPSNRGFVQAVVAISHRHRKHPAGAACG